VELLKYDKGLQIGTGGLCLLFFVVCLIGSMIHAYRTRRRRAFHKRVPFDPSAFREQLVEDIVRDAGGRPQASREQPARPPDARVPKGLIYGGLFAFVLVVLLLAAMAIAAARSIESGTDPSVARTAILSIVFGLVLLVAVLGAVVIVVARMLLRQHERKPEFLPASEPSANRPYTPTPVPARHMGARQCPVCEATIPDDSPEGLCPKCVLGRCMKVPESPILSPVVQQTTPFDGPSPAPIPSDLASKFAGLEILDLLGQGGMGAVYKARQSKLDRIVAVKVLPAEWGKDPAFAERFAREAKALARLSHPHVVAVHDFGESDGLFYLVMEYVDGANLRNILANGGLEPHEALAIVPQICDALQYAHEEGVVHRDIKPENILLDSKGRVKIADFGLAKLTNRPRATFTLTGSQQIMGTLDYMAPEQRLSPQQVDHRADIYSLGVVFYEMLTGELPLGRFAPPSQKSGVDARLDGIVFRALEREPEQRYQRISDMKIELGVLTGQRVATSTPTPDARAVHDRSRDEYLRWRMRIDKVAILLAFLAVLGWVSCVTYWSALADSSRHNQLLFALALVSIPLSVLVTVGAWQASRRENYTLVWMATVLSMLPWYFGFPFALIIGFWILAELSKPRVRLLFSGARGPGFIPAGREGGRRMATEMRRDLLCLPIKIGSLSDHRYPGMLRLEGETLVLEYMKGYVRAKIREAVIQISHLRLIRLTEGWFFTSLVLQTASLKPLEGIPTASQGRLVLSISRKDLGIAERLIRAIQEKVPAVQVEGPQEFDWKEPAWPANASPAALPAAPVPQQTNPVRRKLRSLFNSVYTMFFSRVKNVETPSSDPADERSPSRT
jgi:tRNA A-37 threonylcarbamoyl transferase component Bud32